MTRLPERKTIGEQMYIRLTEEEIVERRFAKTVAELNKLLLNWGYDEAIDAAMRLRILLVDGNPNLWDEVRAEEYSYPKGLFIYDEAVRGQSPKNLPTISVVMKNGEQKELPTFKGIFRNAYPEDGDLTKVGYCRKNNQEFVGQTVCTFQGENFRILDFIKLVANGKFGVHGKLAENSKTKRLQNIEKGLNGGVEHENWQHVIKQTSILTVLSLWDISKEISERTGLTPPSN